jgi:hypothetical protein
MKDIKMTDEEDIYEAFKQYDEKLAKMVEECDYELKLAITQWVIKHIVDHARDGGSYRYLIYDRLGFDADAYGVLLADGMTISNDFDLNLAPDAREALAKGDHEKLKKILSCCDEPGCYNEVSAGYPALDGRYRMSCGDHYRQYKEYKNAE